MARFGQGLESAEALDSSAPSERRRNRPGGLRVGGLAIELLVFPPHIP